MSDDIEEEAAGLHDQLTAARERAARAAAARDGQLALAADAREALRRAAGVDTVPAAREMIAALRRDLESDVAAVRERLEAAGGTL